MTTTPDLDFERALAVLEGGSNGHKPNSDAQSDLKALATEAERILADDAIPSLERLIHLRSYGDNLTTRVNDSELRQLLWTARRKLNGSIEPHGPGTRLSLKPTPWLWEGVVMEGTTNLVVALPKVGKSRLFSQLLGHLARREQSFLGQQVTTTDANFLIVGTDQPEGDWATCLNLAGLLPDGLTHPRLIGLFDKSHPLHLDDQGIERIADYASQHPGLIILLDSYYACVASLGLQERDANYAGPLLDLQEAIAPHDATLVVIHHSNKGASGEGASASSRGTTALPGAVSQTISLTRLPKPTPLAPTDRRIKLTTEGRGGSPLELLIEQVDEGRSWISHGDADTVARRAAAEGVINDLNERQALALEDLCAHFHATGQGMDAGQLAAALSIEGADPERRGRETLACLANRHLIERAGERPAEGGRGGKPSPIYRPTAVVLDLYPPASPITPFAPNEQPIGAIGVLGDCCGDTRARDRPLPSEPDKQPLPF